MNIKTTYPVMIFTRKNEDRISYTVGLSRKNEDGSYDRAYFPIKFKKGIELENKTRIIISDAFLTFDKWTDEEDKSKTFVYIKCLDYQVADDNETSKDEKKGNYSINADEIELSDEDFPF